MMMLKKIGTFVALAVLVAPAISSADIVSEIHIQQDGTFVGKNISISQKSGGNLFARATWGQAFIRITLVTNASTTYVKNHGEPASIADLKEGHLLDIEGKLASGADSIQITPTRIRDVSLETASKTFSGIVKSVNPSASSFVLVRTPGGPTNVVLSASTVITKGLRIIAVSDIAAGDKILSTAGSYDYPGNTLNATSVEVYQSKAAFAPRNFQGTLKSVSGTALPATLTITVNSTDYTVYLTGQTSILSNNKKPASLTRFIVGDTVRVYGSIRQTNLAEIDAEVVRDTNF